MSKAKKQVLLVFAIFFIILLVLHHFMWMYYDDYGYASLSYLGEQSWTVGPEADSGDVAQFLWYHYMNWAGRPYFVFLVPLLRLGLPVFRIVQSLVILGIVILGYKVVKKKDKDSPWLAALICSVFGLLQASIISDGVLWPAASVSYIFPLLPALGAILAIRNNHKILGGILVLAATWSQEQIAVLVMTVLSLSFIWRWLWSKKARFAKMKEFLSKKFGYEFQAQGIGWSNVYTLIMGILGFCLLMFSPGQLARIHDTSEFYQLSLFGKIKQNTPLIMDGTFGGTNIFLVIILVIVSLYVIYQNRNMKKLCLVSSVWTFLVATLILIRYSDSPLLEVWAIAAMAIWAILLVINYVIYFLRAQRIEFIFMIFGAILATGMMVMAPYFPYRGALAFWLTMGLLMAAIIQQIQPKDFAIAVIGLALINSSTVIYGFYQNDSAQKYNDNALRNSNGSSVITLKKWANTTHGTTPPWTNDYAITLIKYYYGLPQDTEFVWEP